MMKKSTFLVLIILFTAFYGFSQVVSDLVFYNQEGNRFYVVLNGIRQNQNPETNVKITNLTQPYYKAKIIFENKTLGEVDKTLNFNPGTESVFEIRKNKSGVYVIRWQSEIPIAQAPPATAGQTVIVFSATPVDPNVNTNVTQTTITTTQQQVPNQNNNLNVGINTGGTNLNMNVNINDNTNTTTTQTTTQTTTTSQTTVDPNVNQHHAHTHDHYNLPGYNGPIGCPYPMSDNDFTNVKQSISSKSFEDSKLTIAKQVIGSNCLLTRQVKEIMLLFSFESTRLDLAKFSYGYTFDVGNYYMLNDAFTFESSITELNEYINSRK